MTKTEWAALAGEYHAAQAQTGISLAAWCVEKGLRYDTARKWIKSDVDGIRTHDKNGLNEQRKRFAEEYIFDLNGTKAAIRAGYSKNTAKVQAARMLSNVNVHNYIKELIDERSQRTQITSDDVLRMWAEIALFDTNEIIEYRRVNCRYCWGVDNKYQWTVAEFEKEEKKSKERSKPPPENIGGFGFNCTREPNLKCPECFGTGQDKAFINDTRNLSAIGRMAYEGVKISKDGLQVLIASKTEARNNLARHLGLFDPRAKAIAEMEIERRQIELETLRKSVNSGDDKIPDAEYVLKVDEDAPPNPIL